MRYKLGTRLIHLGRTATAARPWLEELKTALDEFAAELQETVKVSVLENKRALVLLRVDSPGPIKISFTPGSSFPLHAGAASKLLLAGLSPAEREAILPENLERFTAQTITDKNILSAHLADITVQGYAVDGEEFLEGLIAVAVPISLPDNEAALSVSFLKPANLSEKISFLLPKMRAFSERMSRTGLRPGL